MTGRFPNPAPRGEWLPTVPRDRSDPQEHRCGLCWGPYGKSAVPCPNEPKKTSQIATEHRPPAPDLNQLLNELEDNDDER